MESYYNTACSHARLYPRSIFHYVLIYNRLPQWLVDKKSVHAIQKRLRAMARGRAEALPEASGSGGPRKACAGGGGANLRMHIIECLLRQALSNASEDA